MQFPKKGKQLKRHKNVEKPAERKLGGTICRTEKTNKINAMRCNFQQDVVSWSLFYAVLLVRSNKNSTGGY